MTNTLESTLRRLLTVCASPEDCTELLQTVHITSAILDQLGDGVSRAVLAQALNLLLLRDLLRRVQSGRNYVEGRIAQGRQIKFDHGALRTVSLGGMGDLPAGERAISRVLLPLGYEQRAVYPLDRLGMTGRAYAHIDFPEDLPQFFVSELHPDRFSPEFQRVVGRVTATSRDPLSDSAKRTLDHIGSARRIPLSQAVELLSQIMRCFQRLHDTPLEADYMALLSESAEMAWIATEGNAFNHATDRVSSIETLITEQRALGRPLKDTVEVSASGRVRQTAFRADVVEREFMDGNGSIVRRAVPGSFFEFIQRERMIDPTTGTEVLDLAFDSRNAQGIFKMTAAA